MTSVRNYRDHLDVTSPRFIATVPVTLITLPIKGLLVVIEALKGTSSFWTIVFLIEDHFGLLIGFN